MTTTHVSLSNVMSRDLSWIDDDTETKALTEKPKESPVGCCPPVTNALQPDFANEITFELLHTFINTYSLANQRTSLPLDIRIICSWAASDNFPFSFNTNTRKVTAKLSRMITRDAWLCVVQVNIRAPPPPRRRRRSAIHPLSRMYIRTPRKSPERHILNPAGLWCGPPAPLPQILNPEPKCSLSVADKSAEGETVKWSCPRVQG